MCSTQFMINQRASMKQEPQNGLKPFNSPVAYPWLSYTFISLDNIMDVFSIVSIIVELIYCFCKFIYSSITHYQHCAFDSCIRSHSSYFWRRPNFFSVSPLLCLYQKPYGQTTVILFRHEDFSATYSSHLLYIPWLQLHHTETWNAIMVFTWSTSGSSLDQIWCILL